MEIFTYVLDGWVCHTCGASSTDFMTIGSHMVSHPGHDAELVRHISGLTPEGWFLVLFGFAIILGLAYVAHSNSSKSTPSSESQIYVQKTDGSYEIQSAVHVKNADGTYELKSTEDFNAMNNASSQIKCIVELSKKIKCEVEVTLNGKTVGFATPSMPLIFDVPRGTEKVAINVKGKKLGKIVLVPDSDYRISVQPTTGYYLLSSTKINFMR